MPARSQDQRAMIARIAAAERWAHVRDRSDATASARAGLRARYEREVDPDGTLPPGELARRADHLMRAHMLRMSLKAAQGRRRLRDSTDQIRESETALDALRDDTESGDRP